MEQHLKILMVDDHPMIIEGYQMTLVATKKPHQHLDIDIAHDCDMANELILKAAKNEPYDICFFDWWNRIWTNKCVINLCTWMSCYF